MVTNLSRYKIDELEIEWGTELGYVRLLLEDRAKFKTYGGQPNIRCKCSNIFGLTATEVNIRAPFDDRPVLQVAYKIYPIKQSSSEELHAPYFNQLKRVLGSPSKVESLYTAWDIKKEYSWSVVVFSAKWLFDDIRISLSVYGGTRNEDSGPCAAGIYIDWINEIKAAKPYIEKPSAFCKLISENIDDYIKLDKFKLLWKQKPFKVIHYEIDNPNIPDEYADLRISQIALYRQELFQTPEVIQDQLQEDEIAFYKIPILNKAFISNRWDTVYISSNENKQLTFYDILPARGSGRKELLVKELIIEDARNSNTLIKLIQHIETNTRVKTQIIEGLDD